VATIASLLAERVTLEVRSVDHVFVAGYVPTLQCEGQVVRFLFGPRLSDPVAGRAGEDRAGVSARD
jgi:hypothetical protein